MKAIVLTEAGPANNLHKKEIETPLIVRDDQVLVRLKAAGINPIDIKIRQAPSRFPVADTTPILGCDGAGVIESVGKGVSNYKVGDEVYYCQCGFNGRQGNYAEYAVVDQAFLAHKPASISFEEAAAAPLVLITAWEALHDRVGVKAGQTVLIHAGAGGVGHVAIQLAKAAGAQVAVTVSTKEKADFARALGADLTILYQEQDVIKTIQDWTDNQGVDIVFDTVGGTLIEQSFSAAKVYGDVVTILGISPDTNWGTARQKNLRVTQELMLTPTMLELDEAKTHQGNILQRCAELFDQKKLAVNVAKTFPLEQAAAAHDYLENEHPIGKVVLMI